MAERVGHFCFVLLSYQLDKTDKKDDNELEVSQVNSMLVHLLLKIIPVSLEVMHICCTNLKASKSEEVGRFIKQLIEAAPDFLIEYLINLQENVDLKNDFLKSRADSSQLPFPMSDGPFFMTLLLTNLKDLVNSNASSVALMKEEIKQVKEDLKIIRSFFGKPSTVGQIIVGFEEETEWIIRKLTSGPAEIDVISIVGMPGLGKTTLAYRVYNAKSVVDHFDVCAWCTVDQERNEKKLLQNIFNQVIGLKGRFSENDIDDDIADKLRKQLFGKRYLIVLDDMWDTATFDELIWPFPELQKGSRVILTSRKKEVALHGKHHSDPLYLRLLRLEESWELLEKRVFGKERCPDELKGVGKMIARKCDGLPLVLDLIGGVISRKEKKEALWLEVLNNLSSFIYKDEEEVVKVIQLSYDHLSDHVKPCLVYLASYAKDEDIMISEMKDLWISQGLVEQIEMKSAEEVVDELISSSLVIPFDCSAEKICFPRLDVLNELEELSFSSSWDSFNEYTHGFPLSLKKMRLQWLALTSDSLSRIARLPNLQELILVYSIIEGGKEWNMEDVTFKNLKYLKLDSVEFSEWQVDAEKSFPVLEMLDISTCDKLMDIPDSFGDIASLKFINNVFGNLRDFHRLKVNGCVEYETIEYVLPHLQLMALRVVNFCFTLLNCQLDKFNESDVSLVNSKLANLLVEVIPVELEVMHICCINFKGSKSEEVGRFIKQLLEASPDILRESLIHLQEHMVINAVTPGASTCNIHVDLKNDFLKARADSSQLRFPMSDGPLFMTLLLTNLNDLVNSNAYSVSLIKEEIGRVKEDLEIIRSFFGFNENDIDDDVADKLRKQLFGKRYLIVLDDMWDTATLDELTRPFPELQKGSRVILTSRKKEVALHGKCHSDPLYLRLLRSEESWELLEKRVFGEECCPDELKDVGEKIARKCDGLPLVLDLIGGVISKKDKKEALWHEVLNNLSSFILKDEEEVVKVIQLSYDHLSDHVKPCLVCLASYPKDKSIRISELKNLWIGEGLVEQIEMRSAEEVVDELISSSLVIPFDNSICKIHDLVHDFCSIKSRKEKVFNVIGEKICFPRLDVLNELERLCLSASSWYSFHEYTHGFPLSLKTLNLKTLALTSSTLPTIARLPNLQELCLVNVIIEEGKEWNMEDVTFQNLKSLTLVQVKFSEWQVDAEKSFPVLKKLHIGSCDKLMDIPDSFGDIASLESACQGLEKLLCHTVYNDKSIVDHFDICAWCTVDQERDDKKLLQKIFNQAIGLKERFNENDIDDDVVDKLRKQLFGKRYLIVLDDMWDTATLDELTRPFPELQKGSRVILTSRKKEVALHGKCHSDPLYLRLLRSEESWELLEKRVFGEECCPDELKDVGE
ncbi:hypothetical protein RDI58_014035 [Solanum bulbocastanum]|uniref:NB-ARC domain-containing protein n=1 Tax=Solanum bulbocastanum TaxID=147425 RepID=A0AAN8TM26_SOLBU